MKNVSKKRVIIFLIFLSLLLPIVDITQAAGNTEISLGPENRSVTIGDTFMFYLNVTADGDDPVSGWEIETFNFTSGVVNLTAVHQGTYLSDFGATAYIKGTIHNSSGYLSGTYCYTPGGENTTTSGNMCHIHARAYGVGVSPINFSVDLSMQGSPVIHISNFGNVTVYPESASGSTATTYDHNRIDVAWTTPFSDGVDKIVVFANHTGTAASRNPSDEIYNGTGSSYQHTGLSPSQMWNYSFWGWNETASLYSLLFQQDSDTTDPAPVSGTWILLGDPTPANDTDYAYKTSQAVSIPIVGGYLTSVISESKTKGTANGIDSLSHQYFRNITDVRQGATHYTEDVDYTIDLYDGDINWSLGGSEPSTGTTYYVNYTYIYNTASSFKYWINTTTGQKTENAVSSGTKTYTMTPITGGRQWWNVSASFQGNETHGNYTFYVNQKPRGGIAPTDWDETPAHASSSISIGTSLSVNTEDLDGDDINVTFYWRNGTRIDNDTVIGSGVASVTPSTLDYNTEYEWYINASDGTNWARGPTAGYWSFNTTTIGISLTKDWRLNSVNNTIRCWINVTNAGSTNFTNVNIWDRDHSGLRLISYNHTADYSVIGTRLNWQIPYLNSSGYENNHYNITMLYGLYTNPTPTNGTTFWNYANLSHLGLTSGENVTGYDIGFTVHIESNRSSVNDSILTMKWWINITNTGDFNLTNIRVNETYPSCVNYEGSNIIPTGDANKFTIPYIRPGQTYSLYINMSIDPDCVENGTRVYNNVTVRNNQLAEDEYSEYLSYGGFTSQLRVTYDTTLTDVSGVGGNVFNILGMVLILAAILTIVGLVYKFGYFGKGG